jgi:hypothetical protein
MPSLQVEPQDWTVRVPRTVVPAPLDLFFRLLKGASATESQHATTENANQAAVESWMSALEAQYREDAVQHRVRVKICNCRFENKPIVMYMQMLTFE